jgi:hypothetical protein
MSNQNTPAGAMSNGIFEERFGSLERSQIEHRHRLDEVANRFTAVDARLDTMDRKMDEGFKSILTLLQHNVVKNEPPNEEPILPTPQETTLPLPETPFSTPVNHPRVHYQDANFRHIEHPQVHHRMQEIQPVTSYFDRHMSTNSFLEPPPSASIVRTMAPIDPAKSGVCLTYLDVSSVYKWTKELLTLQRKHPYETLQHGLFISQSMSFKINAWNDAKKYFGRPIILGSQLNLPNKELFEIISHIVLPKNEQEWIFYFKKLVTFRKLPRNQQESQPDTARFDDWYNGTIEYSYEANSVVDLLSSLPDADFAPPMRSFNGKPGLVQLFFDQIPMQTGKNINAMLDQYAVKACRTLREYTVLFQEKLQIIQDSSDDAKLNRNRMSRDTTLMEDKETHRFNNTPNKYLVNNNNNNKFNNDGQNNRLVPFNNNDNNNKNNGQNNNGSRQMVPYRNPHEGRLHYMAESQVCNDYYNRCDIDDYDEYRRDLHNNASNESSVYDKYIDNDEHNVSSDNDCYDIDEVYGNRPDYIEGISPGFNVTNNLNNINNLDPTSSLPCFDEIEGKCLKGARECKYSHNVVILEKEWVKRKQILNKSKYAPREQRQHNHQNVPTSIMKRDPTLRAISTAEMDYKVSDTYINNHRSDSLGREDLSKEKK